MRTKIRMKQAIKQTLKSEDTEEPIDIYFYRPIGYLMALLAERLRITPNMITVASIFIGAAAGILFYYSSLAVNIIGMFLLMLANSFDSADGQLARMTNNKTKLGRILDGFAGNIWFIIIYVVLVFRVVHQGFYGLNPIWIWVIGAAAGGSHIIHAAIADYYRTIHLHFLSYGKNSEFEGSEQVVAQYQSLSWRKNFVEKAMMFFYRNYTIEQETCTPNFQKFIKKLRLNYPKGELPTDLCEEFRAKSKPLMKYTNILQFNTRVIVLFICLFLNQPFLYFAFDLIVLNGILIYMVLKHEKISKRLLLKI